MTEITQWLTSYMHATPPCLFHAITGLYCPGCGGTRAVYLLLSGHPIVSFYFHPLVLYTLVASIYILLRFFISLWKRKYTKKAGTKLYRPSPRWLWGALILLVINVIIKNAFLVFIGIDPLML